MQKFYLNGERVTEDIETMTEFYYKQEFRLYTWSEWPCRITHSKLDGNDGLCETKNVLCDSLVYKNNIQSNNVYNSL